MISWRRKWQPTPVLLPRKSHGRRSLVCSSPWDAKSQRQLSDFTFTWFSLRLSSVSHNWRNRTLSLSHLSQETGFLSDVCFLLSLYLAVPGLSCSIQDLVPWPGSKPKLPALGTWSLSHWTTREVPYICWFWWRSNIVSKGVWLWG